MGLINWQRILLDTSVLIRVLDFKKNGKPANEFANSLVEFLSNTEAQVSDNKKAKRRYYISSISIAEIIDSTQPSSSEKTKLIIQALNANNVQVIDFDEDVANIFSLEFVEKLGVNYAKDILSKWGEINSKVNREILTKDLMILASGIYNDVDAYLCVDKGMYKLGREVNLEMVYVKKEFFNFNDKYFFEFYKQKCDTELKVSSSSLKEI
ncbi:hypothetical protein [Gramella sp. MAR_2010_147]|uniref:hypothetical protein n=1 Tax=Gramella sp. MAR_2010_147 TaxID=1250205 RepID=UPI000879B3D1|nr:hypothetical protein [Gramella sp. MAR_2010_147]SDS06067.1 hypothetical protein SAMN04488553_1375 [Gramella sp. MAR_2010_147]